MTPMQLGVEAETQIFLLSCAAGGFMGAAYDCLRALREMVKHCKAAEFIEDMLYAMFFGGVYFIFAVGNTGRLRAFTLFGMIIGACLERAAIGNFVVKLAKAFSNFTQRFIGKPLIELIDKIHLRKRDGFVKNSPKFEKDKKIPKKVLKV